MKYLKIIITLLFLFVAGVFLHSPEIYMQSFFDGLTVWAHNVLPALFPFAVLSALAVKFFPKPRFSLCKKLFGVTADDLYIVSLLCGYPIGAKCIAESSCERDTATLLCSFCSSASPVFLIATVGTKLLQSASATAVVVFAHLASTLLNGLLYRKKQQTQLFLHDCFNWKDVGDSVTSAVFSVLSVGGLVALFFMLGDIVESFLPQQFSHSVVVGFALGLLEMTNGVIAVCNCSDTFTATVLCSFLLSFGGICVFAQSITFLAKKQVKPLAYLKMKLTQASIATIISFVLAKLLLR